LGPTDSMCGGGENKFYTGNRTPSLSIHKPVTLVTELDRARNWNISAIVG